MAIPSLKLFKAICLMGLVGLGILSIIASGGDSDQDVGDGEGTVLIYNSDDKDYELELRKLSDNSVVGSGTIFAVDVDDSDWIYRFTNVPNGNYYLMISRDGTEQDRTGSFSITGNTEHCHRINKDGKFEGC